MAKDKFQWFDEDTLLNEDTLRALARYGDVAPLVRQAEEPSFDWTYQPPILWADRNTLDTQAELTKIALATLVARMGGAVQFPRRQLESCNLTLKCRTVVDDGVPMIRFDTNHHAGNPVSKINEFADRWEQRAALLPSDAAGEIIDMAGELRAFAEGLFA